MTASPEVGDEGKGKHGLFRRRNKEAEAPVQDARSTPAPDQEGKGRSWNPFRRGKADAVPPGPGGPSGFDDEDDRSLLSRLLHSWPVRIALGFAGLSALAFGAYALFFLPEPVVLAPKVVVIPLPGPTFDPVEFEEPTDFLASLPRQDMTYGLTAFESNDARAISTWPARFAESWLLTYGDGSGSEMTVEAVQHFNEDDALAAFDTFVARAEADAEATAPEPSAEPSPSPSVSPDPLVIPEPVHVGSEETGAWIKITAEVTETIPGGEGEEPTEVTRIVSQVIWRNGTAVFIMTADPEVIDNLFLEYGV